jgi:TRAP-type transport system periplasmic protein
MNGLSKISSCIVLFSAFMSLTAPSLAETFKLSTNSSPTHWSSAEGFIPFMDCVRRETSDQVTFEFFPSSQLASTTESLNAVNSGLVEVSYLALSVLSERMPISGISMLPDLGDSAVHATRAMRKVLDTDGPFRQEFANNRVHPLFIIMNPPYQVLSRNAVFATANAFKGKKIRSSGSALTLALQSLGAAAVEITPSDIYLALQQGVVEGAVLSLPSVKSYRLQEVVKWISRNGSFGNAAAVLALDKARWDALSPDKQNAMTTCSAAIEEHVAQYLDASNSQLASEFSAKGIKMHEYSPQEWGEVASVLREAAHAYVSRLNSRGLPGQQAYEMYLKALE